MTEEPDPRAHPAGFRLRQLHGEPSINRSHERHAHERNIHRGGGIHAVLFLRPDELTRPSGADAQSTPPEML